MGVGSCEFESHLGHSKRSVISWLPTFLFLCPSGPVSPARGLACHTTLRRGIQKYPARHFAFDAEVWGIPHLMRYPEIFSSLFGGQSVGGYCAGWGKSGKSICGKERKVYIFFFPISVKEKNEWLNSKSGVIYFVFS